MTLREKQDFFGFVDGETKCNDCSQVLTREDCWWGFGSWWHQKKETCTNNKEK